MNFTEGKVREDLMLFLSNLFRVNVKQDQDLPPPLPPPTGLPSSVTGCLKFGKLSGLVFRRNLISLGKNPSFITSFSLLNDISKTLTNQ